MVTFLISVHSLNSHIQVKRENYSISRLSGEENGDIVSILPGTSSGYPKLTAETQRVTKSPTENLRYFLPLLNPLSLLVIQRDHSYSSGGKKYCLGQSWVCDRPNTPHEKHPLYTIQL